MDYKKLRIVFLGTPDFAVSSLKKLVDAGCNIVGVITAPDKPAGRGMALQQSAVKKYSVENNLKVLQPEKLKNPEFIEELKILKADIQIVVAFRMLPEIVWNMPPMGTINVHGSLLPQYRGAAPINWAIINGEKFTGVTTFKLKHEIDTGNILLQKRIDISEEMNAGSLHDIMKEVGAGLLLETIESIAINSIESIEKPQLDNVDLSSLRHAPKIFSETCAIDFTKTGDEILNQIRGLSPYPTAYTFLQEKKLKIFSANKEHTTHSDIAGAFKTDGKSYLKFACLDGYIMAKEIQLEGKRRMNIEEFLRGWRL